MLNNFYNNFKRIFKASKSCQGYTNTLTMLNTHTFYLVGTAQMCRECAGGNSWGGIRREWRRNFKARDGSWSYSPPPGGKLKVGKQAGKKEAGNSGGDFFKTGKWNIPPHLLLKQNYKSPTIKSSNLPKILYSTSPKQYPSWPVSNINNRLANIFNHKLWIWIPFISRISLRGRRPFLWAH